MMKALLSPNRVCRAFRKLFLRWVRMPNPEADFQKRCAEELLANLRLASGFVRRREGHYRDMAIAIGTAIRSSGMPLDTRALTQLPNARATGSDGEFWGMADFLDRLFLKAYRAGALRQAPGWALVRTGGGRGGRSHRAQHLFVVAPLAAMYRKAGFGQLPLPLSEPIGALPEAETEVAVDVARPGIEQRRAAADGLQVASQPPAQVMPPSSGSTKPAAVPRPASSQPVAESVTRVPMRLSRYGIWRSKRRSIKVWAAARSLQHDQCRRAPLQGRLTFSAPTSRSRDAGQATAAAATRRVATPDARTESSQATSRFSHFEDTACLAFLAQLSGSRSSSFSAAMLFAVIAFWGVMGWAEKDNVDSSSTEMTIFAPLDRVYRVTFTQASHVSSKIGSGGSALY